MDSMNENVIEFLRDQETATLTLSQGRFISKVRKMAEKYPEECKIIFENKDGSILAHVPTSWIQIRRTGEREYTEEQREAIRKRGEVYRKSLSTTKQS